MKPGFLRTAFVVLAVAGATRAQKFSAEVQSFVSQDAPVIALTHVRVIDGTGASARADQTIVLSGGKIAAMGDAASTKIPEGAKVLDLTGPRGPEHLAFDRLILAIGVNPAKDQLFSVEERVAMARSLTAWACRAITSS